MKSITIHPPTYWTHVKPSNVVLASEKGNTLAMAMALCGFEDLQLSGVDANKLLYATHFSHDPRPLFECEDMAELVNEKPFGWWVQACEVMEKEQRSLHQLLKIGTIYQVQGNALPFYSIAAGIRKAVKEWWVGMQNRPLESDPEMERIAGDRFAKYGSWLYVEAAKDAFPAMSVQEIEALETNKVLTGIWYLAESTLVQSQRMKELSKKKS